MTLRGGLWVVWTAALVCVSAGLAHAQKKKKKDGLFDFQPWQTPVGRQHDAAQDLAPAGLERTPGLAPVGEARTIRLRIYADSDYRAAVIRWQAKARAQVQRVNAVAGAALNVRFEIESLRDWDRSHIGVPLSGAMLDELHVLDDGQQVDLVVGFVTPLHGVASSAHSIGYASYLSRHFVLRGMDDEQEFRAFEREFGLLGPEEREGLYTARKAHKEVACFLHEWGHTLGLIHHDDRKLFMNLAYDPQEKEFSDYDKRILELVIERRLAARHVANPESADLLQLLVAMPASEGSEADRAMLLDLVRRRTEAVSLPARQNTVNLSAADISAFNRAVETFNAGRPADAWKILAPVVMHARERKLDNQTWLRIADLAAAIGALTEADDAAGRAGRSPEAQKVAASIESRRHRIALPLDAAKRGVPPEREPAYVAAYEATAKLIDALDLAGARVRLGELAAEFPDAPGIDVLNCDLELQAKHATVAAKQCESALEKFKGATRAHILLAVIAFSMHRGPVGEQHLRTAIRLDPLEPTGWSVLAQYYRSTRASRQLTALENEHKELLASPLPK